MTCRLFDKERYQAYWLTLQCAEHFSDWKWLGDALRYYWLSSTRHVYLHVSMALYGCWYRG